MANLKLLKKKVLISGANGLLGQKLVERFSKDHEVHGLDITPGSLLDIDGYKYLQADITERRSLLDVAKSVGPDIILNAAAYTNVDASEEDKEICWKVNVIGVQNLAHAAKSAGAFLVHISTDYVFDGVDGNYNEESIPNPLGYYGRSKLAGENELVGSGAEYAILRTMVLYGVGQGLRLNFATWLVEQLRAGKPVKIVDDQFGHPTLADDLALAVHKVAELRSTGIFHVTGSEYGSRYDFAVTLSRVFGFDQSLISRIKTSDLNQKAPRPLNSSFNLSRCKNELGLELCNIEQGIRALKQQLAGQA